MAMFAVNKSRFPGVNLERRMQRFYPLGTVASHVIGYVGRIDDRDLERLDKNNYAGTSHIGKVGVEGLRMKIVCTVKPAMIWMKSMHTGRRQDMIERKEAVGGQDLIFRLDINVQLKAEALLMGERGAVVAIDPRNGEVLAMAVPTFDPNLSWMDSSSFIPELRDDPDRPLTIVCATRCVSARLDSQTYEHNGWFRRK